ncbi:hypothetical protein SRABI04_00023 [Chryseobacterium sp. Bi04]|nr:hypothetical protein SRABI04_00023 [Chryseobacterium sp. Bi04]
MVDFTEKTDQEIQNIIKNAIGQEICGRISFPFSKIAAELVLVANLTFVRVQSKYFIFEDKIAEIIARKSYLNSLHLLYSKLKIKEAISQLVKTAFFMNSYMRRVFRLNDSQPTSFSCETASLFYRYAEKNYTSWIKRLISALINNSS